MEGTSLQHQKGGIAVVEDYRQQLRAFHGSNAPGLIIGGFMVNLGIEGIREYMQVQTLTTYED